MIVRGKLLRARLVLPVAPLLLDRPFDPVGEAPLDIGKGVGIEQVPISASGTPAVARVRTWTSRSRSAEASHR
ncbi:hypothetical protein ACIBHX_48660 [Nonomuraea sp. NPDC050536]|uniref:hypothetical protein n=1 Tax=Nonomuraea sp. NPDC050536 TaxID=3364366 RepID=UPI0037C56119